MRHLAALAVVLLVPPPARLGADTLPASPPFPLWPIPREARVANTRLLLTDATIVVPPGDARAQYPGRLLAELIADHFGVAIPLAVGAAPSGRTPIVVGDASAGVVAAAVAGSGATVPEGYLLSVEASGAVVAGRDYRGALYGVSSFVQIVHRWGRHSVAVRQAVVRDWPFLPICWVHLEVLRPKRVHIGHDEWRAGAFCPRCHLLPNVRGMLAQEPLPSYGADPMRFEVQDVASAFNHPPKGDSWDLRGLRPGRHYVAGLPFAIADPARWGGLSAVRVARRPGDSPTRAELPIRGCWASLVFIQSASGEGRPAIHAGDQTHFPRESSELLGFYEIRYDETVGRWDASLTLPFTFARPLLAGTLPDGRTAVVWASEWANPRPDVPIASVTLAGSPGSSKARPILFGVTAVDKPRVEDLR